MSLAYYDRVAETTTTTGTGTVTLAGAKQGYRSFSVVGNGNTCPYCITDGTNWEVGSGTYTSSGTTLSRTTIFASSNGGSAVSFGVGTKDVFLDWPASQIASLASGQIPQYITSGWVGLMPWLQTCDFRLSLSTGNAYPPDVSAVLTSLYLTPIANDGVVTTAHGFVWLYDGTNWKLYESTEISKSWSTNVFVAMQAYDVFLYDNSGTLTQEWIEWNNSTVTMTIASPCVVTWTGHGLTTGQSVTFTTTGSLPTGLTANLRYFVNVIDANTFKLATSNVNATVNASFVTTTGTQSGTHTAHSPTSRATALAEQDGVLVKSTDHTRRYVGSFLALYPDTLTDTASQRFLWNNQHRFERPLVTLVGGPTLNPGWSTNRATWSQANAGDISKAVECFVGRITEPFCMQIEVPTFAAAGGAAATIMDVGIGIDTCASAATNSTYGNWSGSNSGGGSGYAQIEAFLPSIGYHYVAWIEATNANVTFFSTGAGWTRKGMVGTVVA